jgi:hypothetical protein
VIAREREHALAGKPREHPLLLGRGVRMVTAARDVEPSHALEGGADVKRVAERAEARRLQERLRERDVGGAAVAVEDVAPRRARDVDRAGRTMTTSR